MGQNGSKGGHRGSKWSKWVKIGQYVSKWFKMVQNGGKMGAKWVVTEGQNGYNGSK